MKPIKLGLSIGVAMLTSVAVSQAMAEEIDPAHAEAWEFMQANMPGVPYQLLVDACEEGEVLIYQGTWAAAQENQAKHFEERFPCVHAELFQLQAGVLRTRFISETAGGQYIADIVQDSSVAPLIDHKENGRLANYVISNDDHFADIDKDSGIWYPLRHGMVGIAWNTDLVSDEEAEILSTWEGMLDPRWKGRIGVVPAKSVGIVASSFFTVQGAVGEELYPRLGALEPRLYTGTVPSAAALASGDISVLFPASETGLLPLFDQGAPIKWSLPEPSVGPLTAQAISANAPNPSAARLYQEYAFTEEGYGFWQEMGGAPARIGFKDRRPVAAEAWYTLPDEFDNYDPDELGAAVQNILDLFKEHVKP